MSPKPRSRKQVLQAMPSADRGDREDFTYSQPSEVGLEHVGRIPEKGKEVTPSETDYRQEVGGEFEGRDIGPTDPVIEGLGTNDLGRTVLPTLQRIASSTSFPG